MKNNKNQKILFLIAGGIALLISLFFRFYPIIFPSSLEAEEKAMILLREQLKNDISRQVERSFPGLSAEEKTFMANQQFRQILSADKATIQRALRDLTRSIHRQMTQEKINLGKRPEIFITGSDGYYFYGLTKNIASGKPIMQKRDGPKYFNDMMLAPVGYWEAVSFLPFVGYASYRFIRLFDPGASVMFGVSFTSPLLVILCSIFFLLICKTLGLSALSSSMALLFFLSSHIVLRRSLFGWFDNDPATLFFTFMTIWLFMMGFKFREHLLKSLSFAFLCAGSLTLYAFFWQGWVYLLSVLSLAAASMILFFIFIKPDKKESKQILIFCSAVLITTAFGSIASFGLNGFFFLFIEGISVLKDFILPQTSVWPDLYIAVGELHRASLERSLELTGGLLFIIIGFIGILYSVFKTIKQRTQENIFNLALLLIFFSSALALALTSQRFILLLVMPLGLFSAFGFQAIYHVLFLLTNRIPTEKQIKNKINAACITAVSFLFLASPLIRSHGLASRMRPIFDQTWNAALTRIRLETPKDSIINSWWPPGHFIKSIAQRRVISDGATISVPQAYWMAKILFNQDEHNAIGLLRMLNTSSNQAVEYLESLGLKTSEAVGLIKRITPLSKKKANAFILNHLTPDQASTLLDLTHGNPPAAYLFLYNDLIDQYLGVTLVANWEISQMEKIFEMPHLQRRIRSMSTPEYVDFLLDIQGGMPRVSEPLQEIKRQDSIIFFEQGISFDLKQNLCRIASPKFGQGIPKSIIFVDNNTINEKTMANANLGFSVVFFQQDSPSGPYTAIVMDQSIANSLMMKMYYLEGKGLRYFRLFDKQKSIGGRTILYTYKIDWQRYFEDLEE